MKDYLERYANWLIPSTLIASMLWLHFRVQSILPAVMQDEYIYSMQARMIPLAELQYPNFFYSWVYSFTSQCGVGFYSCTKTLNLVFFAGFVVVIYFLAMQWLGKWMAFLIALATSLSPIGMFTSLFMPESMYFFFALLSFVGLLWAGRRLQWWVYLLAGFVLGLTSLIKPHALFLLVAAVIFIAVSNWGRWLDFAYKVGIYIGGVVLVKFGLGFILAGPSAFTLFGPSYTGSLINFTENLQGAAPETPIALPDNLAAAPASGFGISSFIAESGWQLIWQLFAVFLIAAGSLVAVSRATAGKSSKAFPSDLVRYNQLSVLMLLSMVVVISLFAAMVTLSGDIHTNRLLLRYYEFLFPILLIGAAATIKRSVKSKLIASYLLAAGALVLSAVGFFAWLPGLRQLFADSPTMMGITSSGFNQGFTLVAAVAAVVFVLIRGNAALSGFLAISLLIAVLLGFTSIDRLHAQASKISPADSAGIFARDYLAAVDPGTIYYLGSNKQLTLASIFALDRPNVGYQVVDPTNLVPLSSLPPEVEWVVLLDGIQLEGEPSYRVEGNGWALERIGAGPHDFSKTMIDSPLASFIGLDIEAPFGRWNSAGVITFNFSEPLPINARIYVELILGENLANTVQMVEVGDSKLPLELGAAGQLLSGELVFQNSQPADSLIITLTDSSPKGIGFLKIGTSGN